MFHLLSNLFWTIFQPITFSVILVGLSFIASLKEWRWTSMLFSGTAFLIFVLAGWTTFGALLLQPLEDRYARMQPDPSNLKGIIVLGGGFEGAINLARGGYELNASGDRFVEAAVLARKYPTVPVIVSGGTGALFLDGATDADSASLMLQALGVERDRIVLEGGSRSTYENAALTQEILLPTPDQSYLLVTSAFHMPRAMSVFRKAGFKVLPWPVDYNTTGKEGIGLAQDNVLDSMRASTIAIREWIALYMYWMTGRTEAILP